MNNGRNLLLFVAVISGGFVYICNAIPQIESQPAVLPGNGEQTNAESLDELPPTCPDCGGVAKSDTVMFGEAIPRDAMEQCIMQSQMCDCMLLVGTSATVYPAAGFPLDVKRSGGRLIEVNPNETPLTELSDVVLRAPAGESLSLVVSRLREMREAA